MTQPSMPQCPACRSPLSAQELVDACARYWREVRATEFTCPRCGEVTAVRLEPGWVHFGYIYAAGAPHFAAEERQPVPELSGIGADGGDLIVRILDREIRIRAPTG